MAVYTELTQEEIRQFLRQYDLPALVRADGIKAGVENTNYLIVLEDGSRRILTLFEKRVNAADLPFFTSLMETLAEQGVPAPLPLHDKSCKTIGELKGKPALIVTFLEGKDVTDIKEHHLAQLGHVMAKLHIAGKAEKLSRANGLSYNAWKVIADKIILRADEIEKGLAQELHNEIAFFAGTWPQGLPTGVVHADLFPDNVFFDADGKLTGIIDFYFACNDMLAYDLAVCINSWCFEKQNVWQWNEAKAKTLIKHYHKARPLSDNEMEALPVLLRGAALRFLLTRTHDKLFAESGAFVNVKDPMEYLQKLRFFRHLPKGWRIL